MGCNYCEIWRDARIAGQPEKHDPICIHLFSIADKAVNVNAFWDYNVTIHGALHHAARHPAGKIAVACIQPLAVRRLFNGLDALQFAAGWAVNCN